MSAGRIMGGTERAVATPSTMQSGMRSALRSGGSQRSALEGVDQRQNKQLGAIEELGQEEEPSSPPRQVIYIDTPPCNGQCLCVWRILQRGWRVCVEVTGCRQMGQPAHPRPPRRGTTRPGTRQPGRESHTHPSPSDTQRVNPSPSYMCGVSSRKQRRAPVEHLSTW